MIMRKKELERTFNTLFTHWENSFLQSLIFEDYINYRSRKVSTIHNFTGFNYRKIKMTAVSCHFVISSRFMTWFMTQYMTLMSFDSLKRMWWQYINQTKLNHRWPVIVWSQHNFNSIDHTNTCSDKQ